MKRMVSVIAASLLAACSLAPRYERPASPVPQTFPQGGAYGMPKVPYRPPVYRDVFTDARLQTLMQQALVNNRDLRVAIANIEAAQAAYRIQWADRIPHIDGSGEQRFGRLGGNPRTSLSVGVTSFELDLFGRVKSLSDAALERYLATAQAMRVTRLSMLGTIAQGWLAYATDASLLRIAEGTAQVAGDSVRLTRSRLQYGAAARLDLSQAEQVLATANSDVVRQRTALAQDLNLLQLLVGAPIEPTLLEPSIEAAGATLAALPTGLDSSVLLNRPDIAEAEHQLQAANADIGVARAALFPVISLSALVGLTHDGVSGLFSHGTSSGSGAVGLDIPIFEAGARIANVDQARAQFRAALASYEKTVQSAFRDTADALAREGTIADQLRYDEDSVRATDDSYRLSDARYRGGVDSFLASLDAQRSLYAAQRTLASTRLEAANNRVALYLALGEGSSGPLE